MSIVCKNVSSSDIDNHIDQWIAVDDLLKKHNDKIRELRTAKTRLNQLIQYYVENNYLETSFERNGQKLKVIETKDVQPLSYTFLESCLHKIISKPEQVRQIIDFIKKQREVKYVSEVRRV